MKENEYILKYLNNPLNLRLIKDKQTKKYHQKYYKN